MPTTDMQSQESASRPVVRVGKWLWRWLTSGNRIESNLNEKLKIFNELKGLSDDDKTKMRASFVRLETRMAQYDARSELYERSLLFVAFAVTVAILSKVSGNYFIYAYMITYSLAAAIFISRYLIRMRWFTDSYLVDELLKLIQFVEENEGDWLQLEFRRQVITKLESIARVVERDVRRALPGGDATTRQWIRERTWQTAAGIRDLKTWLVIPNPLTREDLLGNKLVPTFVGAVTGDWDKMEKASRLPPGDASTWIRFVGKAFALIVSVIAVAFLAASFFIQTSKGKEFLNEQGISGDAAGLATVISSISAGLVLYRAQFGKIRLIGEDEAKKAAEAVVGPAEPA